MEGHDTMDTLTPEQRSQTMARVRGRDTSLELRVRRLIFAMGYRYKLQGRDLPGVPDIVFPSRKKVIFVHGCFWHGHKNCRSGQKLPKTNANYWLPKLAKNKARDAFNQAKLRDMGWECLVVWECQTKDENFLRGVLGKFLGTHGRKS
jgi:DNA mismatch endonuclease (patch repair protein)